MDGDPFPAAERIIADIESIFKKDPKLKEFQILGVSLNENKSPVHHVEHCLGLESWCVSHVYCHTHSRLMDIRLQKGRPEEVSHVNQLLIVALLINPDVSLFWNMRRELVSNERIDPQFELHLTSVILTRKPKSSEVFSYRRWLIQKLFGSFPSDSDLLVSELYVCGMAADLYSKNYHAWNHRIWCLDFVSDPSASLSVNAEEWQWSQEWVSSHVSDHSGFHYRQKVLENLINFSSVDSGVLKRNASKVVNRSVSMLQFFLHNAEGNGMSTDDYKLTKTTVKIVKDSSENCEIYFESISLGLIVSELLFNTDLLSTFPGHEAIWCHRRFVLYAFKKCVSELKTQIHTNSHKDFNGIPVEKDPKVECVTERLERRLLRFEESYCNKCKDDKDGQAIYAQKHRSWLSTVLKLSYPVFTR